MKRVWIVFCSQKNEQLKQTKGRFNSCFDDCIIEIEDKNFIIVNSPGHRNKLQKSFLVRLQGYPVIVPFKRHAMVIQLITMFPDRRYKDEC